MDKCLPILDLARTHKNGESNTSEGVTSPIILEDMSLFYFRQLASSLQVNIIDLIEPSLQII